MEPQDLMELLVPPRAYVTRAELFTIEGTPIAWKRALRNGNTYYTHPKQKAWQERVRFEVSRQWTLGPVDGPCLLDVIACLKRPRKHFLDQGALRGSAPFFSVSHKCGDADNHLKGIADALQGVKKKGRVGTLYNDDCQIVGGSGHKVYADGLGEELEGTGGGIPVGVIIQFSVVDPDWGGRGAG